MNKRWMTGILAGMLALAVTACGTESKKEDQDTKVSTESSENAQEKQETEETKQETEESEQKTEETEKETEVKQQEEEEVVQEGDAATYFVEQYKEVLDMHFTAYKEKWEESQMVENSLSLMASYAYSTDPLEDYGYAFLDADGDGSYELLFGLIEETEDYQKVIFEMYTLKDGKPVQVFCSEERNRYYVGCDENGEFVITNCGSSGASETQWEYFTLKEGTLSTIEKIIYSEEEDQENPWYMEKDGNKTNISQEEALEITEGYEKQQIFPEFTRMSLYQG